MEGPRPLLESELPDFIHFLSAHLRDKQNWTIAEEYPLAIHDSNLNNVRVIKSESGFMSAAVMKPLVVKSPAGLFKVAAIGSVVTSPEHRNKGLSRQIMEALIDAGRAHGCDFAILWTDLFDFYRKLGFELAGSEISLILPEKLNGEANGLRFLESNKVDPAAILRLYSQHTSGTVRTVEDIRKFLQIPNSRVFTAWNGENRLEAYAVEGKGADLSGYIHEWGGGVSKLIPLIDFAGRHTGTRLNIIAPAHATNLIHKLAEQGALKHSGVLGMIKLLNPPHFLMKIKKFIRGMGIEDVVLEPRDGKYYLGYRGNIFHTDSETDLVRLIFGPQKAHELHGFDKDTSEVFERVFPISMWIWGWDSV